MTDCSSPAIGELLPDYAHGTLDPGRRAIVEVHLAGCAACAAELEVVRAVQGTFARAPRIDTARIVRALPSPGEPRPALRVESGGAPRVALRRWPSRSASLRIAAGIAAIAVGGAGLWMASERESRVPGATVVASRPAATEPVIAAEPAPPSPSGESPSTAPRTVAAAPRPATSAPATVAMTFGGGVADLSDDALRALLGEIDELSAEPRVEPELELPAVMVEEGR